jgi:hypothetical protein
MLLSTMIHRGREGENLNIAIDDFEFPNVFGLAMGWLYTQKLQDSIGGSPSTHDLYRLWVLADRLLTPKLQNDTIPEIVNQSAKDAPLLRTGSTKPPRRTVSYAVHSLTNVLLR